MPRRPRSRRRAAAPFQAGSFAPHGTCLTPLASANAACLTPPPHAFRLRLDRAQPRVPDRRHRMRQVRDVDKVSGVLAKKIDELDLLEEKIQKFYDTIKAARRGIIELDENGKTLAVRLGFFLCRWRACNMCNVCSACNVTPWCGSASSYIDHACNARNVGKAWLVTPVVSLAPETKACGSAVSPTLLVPVTPVVCK